MARNYDFSSWFPDSIAIPRKMREVKAMQLLEYPVLQE